MVAAGKRSKRAATGERLTLVKQRRLLARCRDPFAPRNLRGYVLGVGAEWCAWLVVEDACSCAGITCLRLADVRDLAPEPHPECVRAGLRWRGERRPRLPRLQLDDTAQTLRAVARAYPLVTNHRERLHPDECNIGRVVGVDRATVQLLEISPGAVWESQATSCRLRDITRIEGGGP